MKITTSPFRGENYPDPVPFACCPICGEEIYPGDLCYETETGLVHGDGVCRVYRDATTGSTLQLSCLMAYLLDTAAAEEIAEAAGIGRKIWC